MTALHNYTFHSRKLIDFSADYINQRLFKLTLTSVGSVMRSRLHLAIYYKKNIPNMIFNGIEDDIVTIVKHNNETIAWANTFHINNSHPKTMLFVNPDFRRNGIGSILLKKHTAYLKRKNIKKTSFAPWDPRSENFYNKIPNTEFSVNNGIFTCTKEL